MEQVSPHTAELHGAAQTSYRSLIVNEGDDVHLFYGLRGGEWGEWGRGVSWSGSVIFLLKIAAPSSV